LRGLKRDRIPAGREREEGKENSRKKYLKNFGGLIKI
jgi:hypothetical protein